MSDDNRCMICGDEMACLYYQGDSKWLCAECDKEAEAAEDECDECGAVTVCLDEYEPGVFLCCDCLEAQEAADSASVKEVTEMAAKLSCDAEDAARWRAIVDAAEKCPERSLFWIEVYSDGKTALARASAKYFEHGCIEFEADTKAAALRELADRLREGTTGC